MQPRLPFDDVAWEQSDNVYFEWRTKLLKPETLTEIALFVAKYHLGTPVEVRTPLTGAYNVAVVIDFRGGGSTLIRFPKPGKVMFPGEKVRNEVAVMRYVQAHTSIPVPFILHWGTKEESPCGLGPFIVMEYVEHACDISDALNTPGISYEERLILDPSIDEENLRKLYRQIADVLLQLSKLSFPRIGSLTQDDDDDTWDVTERPLSSNMNEVVQLGTLPRSKLPDKSATFETSSSYLNTLANLHLSHLTHQRNDAIDSESDCRRKYIARYLFRKLSLKGKLSHPAHNSGPFKLWCDDLRPANMLVNSNLELIAVIDWEFTYSAPVEFSHAPPLWLLIEQPEYWPDEIDEWITAYEPRLQTFLAVLHEREDAFIREGRLEERQRLSLPMRESWESGDFWVVYAARKGFAFDAVFWKYLDARFFGPMAGLDGDEWEKREGWVAG
jgi:aminoglycoside phosphotransferase (APT) family kinase protein